MFRATLLAAALAIGTAGAAHASCAIKNETPLKLLAAGFEAWKAASGAMAECGNFQAELDQEFATKQPPALEAKPALYQLGGVANETLVPLVNGGLIRPLDDLVAKYGQKLRANQKITVDGKIVAIAMMVNAQHLMYRKDIFDQLGIAPPTTYDELLVAAEKIKAAGVVQYPLGATTKAGWNLAQDFNNLFLGFGGSFIKEGGLPNVNNAQGVATLELMRKLTAYMDPEFLVSDSTYVQKQFQQGKIAMANLWASRGGAMDNPSESQVVGKVKMAAAPSAVAGGPPATTLWWDGVVIAKNISDAEAEAAFKVAMEGLDKEMVEANNDAAVWLIEGYRVTDLAQGVIGSMQKGAPPYPATTEMGLMHTALGANLADALKGTRSPEQVLAAVEAAYLTAAREAGIVKP